MRSCKDSFYLYRAGMGEIEKVGDLESLKLDIRNHL